MGERDEGIKKYNLVVTEQSWGSTVQRGNAVDTIAITTHGVWWALEISGDPCEVCDYLTPVLCT